MGRPATLRRGRSFSSNLNKARKQKKLRPILASVLAVPFTALLTPSHHANAANQFWDINGATAGATDSVGGDASGTWDNITSNWATDSAGTGSSGVWVSNNTPVF